MDDLITFLGAQLDEDERVVRDQLCVNCGNRIVPVESFLGVTGYTHEGSWEGRRCPGRLVGAERVQNPSRVLREIDAKRQLLALLPEVEQADLAEKLLGLLLAPYPKCRARAVFWPDDEACDAECVWPRGHGGTRHMDETLGGWDEGELTTSYPSE